MEQPRPNRPHQIRRGDSRTADRLFSRTSALVSLHGRPLGTTKARPVHFEIAHEFDIPLDALELAVISPALVDKLGAKVLELRSYTLKDRVFQHPVWLEPRLYVQP